MCFQATAVSKASQAAVTMRQVSHALTTSLTDTLTTDGAVRGWEVQDLLNFPLCTFKGNNA